MIADWMLDSSVWDALERALNDPAILTKAIGEIKQPIAPASNDLIQLDAAVAAVAGEQKRVLEAYRLSILSPDQLARELELIEGRRQLLEKQKRELNQRRQPALPVSVSVDDYCREIRERLGNLTFETKRSIVRLLLRKVVFEGDQVRISGVIRLPDRNGNPAKLPIGDGSDGGGIGTTGVDSRGRNPATNVAFTLVQAIDRNSERAAAASRANLIKANAASRRLRHPQERI